MIGAESVTATRPATDYSPAALAGAAGVDPWALHGLLASGDAEAILDAAVGFRRAGGLAAEAADDARAADRTTASAFHNDGRPVFDAAASTARTHTLLGDSGEKLEETARALFDVGTTLAENTRRSATRLNALDADISYIVGLRNAFFAANAALSPEDAAAAEQRYWWMGVDVTRRAAGAVQAEVDDYDALLVNRTGRLQALGYQAASVGLSGGEQPSPDPPADRGLLAEVGEAVDDVFADEVAGLGGLLAVADAAGDAVGGALAGALGGVGDAIGGPVGHAIGGAVDEITDVSEAVDDAIGRGGSAAGDAIGGATGEAVVGVAEDIAVDQPPAGTYPGALVPVSNTDDHADRLAESLGGRSRVAFENDPIRREFDAVSDEYIGQAKPADTQIGGKIRAQARATFEAAQESGRSVYYHFEGGPPDRDVVRALERYSERYGVPVTISSEPL